MENTNIEVKNKRDKDLLYSFIFLILVWVVYWQTENIINVIDWIFGLPSLPYIDLMYRISKLGWQSDLTFSVVAYVIPILFLTIAIWLSMRWARKTHADFGKRELFGLIPKTKLGYIALAIIILATLNLMLICRTAIRLNSEPGIFSDIEYSVPSPLI